MFLKNSPKIILNVLQSRLPIFHRMLLKDKMEQSKNNTRPIYRPTIQDFILNFHCIILFLQTMSSSLNSSL